jgi:hypothetical protein
MFFIAGIALFDFPELSQPEKFPFPVLVLEK